MRLESHEVLKNFMKVLLEEKVPQKVRSVKRVKRKKEDILVQKIFEIIKKYNVKNKLLAKTLAKLFKAFLIEEVKKYKEELEKELKKLERRIIYPNEIIVNLYKLNKLYEMQRELTKLVRYLVELDYYLKYLQLEEKYNKVLEEAKKDVRELLFIIRRDLSNMTEKLRESIEKYKKEVREDIIRTIFLLQE